MSLRAIGVIEQGCLQSVSKLIAKSHQLPWDTRALAVSKAVNLRIEVKITIKSLDCRVPLRPSDIFSIMGFYYLGPEYRYIRGSEQLTAPYRDVNRTYMSQESHDNAEYMLPNIPTSKLQTWWVKYMNLVPRVWTVIKDPAGAGSRSEDHISL